MKEIISFAGDITVEKINIQSQDGTTYSITNQLVSIQIFEDLFSSFISGILTIKDSLDFINGLPMIGQELLDISIYTPTLKDKGGHIKGQFYITVLNNREYLAERNVLYELSFISKEAIVDANIKLSKSYIGTASDIAKNVLTDKLVKFDVVKKLNIEPSKNNLSYISNYWSPTRNMQYLCEHAINKEGSPSYVFFENRDGFNFGSLETLSTSPTITQEFKYDNSTQVVTASGTSVRDIQEDYRRVTFFALKKGFNLYQRISSGMFASVVFSADITTKRYNAKIFDYPESFDGTKRLNSYPLFKREDKEFPLYYTAKVINEPRQFDNFTNQGDPSAFQFVQRRISEVLQIDDIAIEINVPGRTDYTVGQVVRITSFQIEPITKSESNRSQLDMIFSGKYVITSINHFITRESHQCSLELIKDSYISSFTK
jgi:hypothetical protein